MDFERIFFVSSNKLSLDFPTNENKAMTALRHQIRELIEQKRVGEMNARMTLQPVGAACPLQPMDAAVCTHYKPVQEAGVCCPAVQHSPEHPGLLSSVRSTK